MLSQENRIQYSSVLNCPENFSEEMNEQIPYSSFIDFEFAQQAESSLYDLPSRAGTEEILSPRRYDTSLSFNSFLKYGPGARSPFSTVVNQGLDLQEQIDRAQAFQTVILPPKLVTVDSLNIRRPIILKGSTGTVLMVTESIKISMRSNDGTPLKRSLNPSPRVAFIEQNKTSLKFSTFIGIEDRFRNSAVLFDNLTVIKNNSKQSPGALFELTGGASLILRDCQLSSKSGKNDLILTTQGERSVLEILSSSILGFTSISQAGLAGLLMQDTMVSDCMSTAVHLSKFDFARVQTCTFNNVGESCISVVAGWSSGQIPTLNISKCSFSGIQKEAILIDTAVTDGPCLDCKITDCTFEDLDSPAFKAMFSNGLPLLVANCTFNRIKNDCCILEGCFNYRVVSCTFDLVDGICLSLHGGQGMVDKCLFKQAVAGIRILGEPQEKPRRNQPASNLSQHMIVVKPLDLRQVALMKPSLEVNRCVFDQLEGNGIEITDTLSIDCAFSDNLIRQCLNGFLIRDFGSPIPDGMVPLNSERTQGAKSVSLNSVLSPMISTTQVVARSYRLANNIIELNKGSGLKIENTQTRVHVEGGKIVKNKDLAIGVVGSLEQGVFIQQDGINKVQVNGEIKEIKYEDYSPEGNKCALI